MSAPNQPSMTDGAGALHTVLLQCLNLAGDGTTYQRYGYMSDNIQPDASVTEHTNSDNEGIGSSTFAGHEKGSIVFKLNDARRKLPKPGYVLQLNRGDGKGDLYYIAGQPGPSYQKNNTIQSSVSVIRAVNPVITSLLSETLGQHKSATATDASTYTLANTVVNTRSGATVTWSLDGAPTDMSINSSTGEITYTTPVVGSYEVTVICTDTLAGYEPRVGFGKLFLEITASGG